MSSSCVIYKITNTHNGKVYIGQTSQGLDQRKREHYYRYSKGERNHKLYLAFRKYGWDSFVFEILAEVPSKEDLNELEIQYIQDYNSFNRGYNMTVGGDFVSDETREKLREIFTGRKITWYDKILESRRKNPNDRTIKLHRLEDESGNILTVRNLAAFCREHGFDACNLHHTKKSKRFVYGYRMLEGSTTSSEERKPEAIAG